MREMFSGCCIRKEKQEEGKVGDRKTIISDILRKFSHQTTIQHDEKVCCVLSFSFELQ
jgi:hypothetical protein